MRALNRPCLECRALTPGSRCPAHARAARPPINPAYRASGYRRTRTRLITEHQLHYGNTCPGWGTPPHPVTPPNQLTIDHQIPLSAGGTNQPENLTIFCQQCNTRKGGTNRERGGRANTRNRMSTRYLPAPKPACESGET
jgi:5-methylcytosine-specific restriction protein A